MSSSLVLQLSSASREGEESEVRTKLIIAASVLLGMAVGVLFMPTAVQAWP